MSCHPQGTLPPDGTPTPDLSGVQTRQDARTHHQALPVGPGGLKYAANAWIHLYDFRKANLWGCTGAFD